METYTQKITFNGKTYSSKDDMPASERGVFEKLTQFFMDKNQNYVPDRFEASGTFEIGKCFISAQVTDGQNEILVNGRKYANPNEMTPEDRHIYETALELLDKNGNGVPDAFEILSDDQINAAFGHGFKPLGSTTSKGPYKGQTKSMNASSGFGSFVAHVLTLGALAAVVYAILAIWDQTR